MPEVEYARVRLHYELSGNPDAEVLVLGNSVGSSLHMWDKALPCFESRYRVVRFDMRGHGNSLPAELCSIGDLGRDVLALLDSLHLGSVNFCGLSLGGMVAMWLGIHAPRRVQRLILADTAARIGTPQMWKERIAFVEQSGMAALAPITLTRWFTATFAKHTQRKWTRFGR